MGFGGRWMGWIELLVFNSKMSVLVNGSSTKEFEVFRGLRQSDPFSPFLYVLVAEGLLGLVTKSIEVGDLAIKGSCWVENIQFAYDTLLVREGTWKHVWAIKAVIQAFEIVSGLGINCHKSKLMGINSRGPFLEAAPVLVKWRKENFISLVFPLVLILGRIRLGILYW
ncbi:uncharacterized protein LOC131659631 [Vicia villosa]|uniref:uncharacterized protein LOC131630191 n=1 Tax=Vicia villosa TaxID=3911 RepID=UPI00273C34DA|nr:uncharacterized protein LOC131630191 [Vicia villosa]XP_058768279.1 uncharacterized protein LOC131642004 [Vicia villosa]XP_058784777.1 uncharacterized protein LOC131659631 [Vicia villosa]